METPKSRWKDHDHWQCLKHIPPVTLPQAAERCWFVGCSTRPAEALRPAWAPPVEKAPPPPPVPIRATQPAPRAARPAVTRVLPPAPETPAAEVCALESCQNIAREGSKYCSRACSNRNARRRFKARNKAA